MSVALIVFTEVHRAAHRLWHTAATSDVLREVDRQIGALVAAAAADAVIIFSLHGMRRAQGLVTCLEAFLIDHRFALRSRSARDRAFSLFAAMKRRMPAPVKRIYYRMMPEPATHAVAQSTMLPRYDWARTRAFALPSDQHGWIRVNLAGREAAGIVPLSGYDALLSEIEDLLRNARTDAGEPLVEEVIRTAPDVARALTTGLPDMVVHWARAAELPPYGTQRMPAPQTGQHAPQGWVVASGIRFDGPLTAANLHRLIRR